MPTSIGPGARRWTHPQLNKRFYREIADWYFWAASAGHLPDGRRLDQKTANGMGLIRLLARVLFVWFMKEKGLVPEALFERTRCGGPAARRSGARCAYYKGILQNLFFATLNAEMDARGKRGSSRRFRKEVAGGRDPDYMVHTVYRYRQLFGDPDAFLALCEGVPFLNGGLFECLDTREEGKPERRLDGFSDNAKNPLSVPTTSSSPASLWWT